MAEIETIAAFVQGRDGCAQDLTTDGRRLFSRGSPIAQWEGAAIRIVSQRGDSVSERHKNLLVEFMLWQIHRDGVIDRVVHAAEQDWRVNRSGRTAPSAHLVSRTTAGARAAEALPVPA